MSCRRSGAARASSNRKAVTGSRLPFNTNGSTGATSTAPPACARVAPRSTLPPAAQPAASRAATFSASPVARRSSVPVTTSPVQPRFAPRSRAPANASRISTAARQARSASSSCTAGTPNTATTASPMNFSTEPPCARRFPSSLEIAGQNRPHSLRISRLPKRRRADHVAKHHRHHLPMLTHPDPERSTTPLTKPGGITVRVATLTTDSHMEQTRTHQQPVPLRLMHFQPVG